MNVVISPKCVSQSAKFLAQSIGAVYINPNKTSQWDFSSFKNVINFGCSQQIKVAGNLINDPLFVGNAVNKIATLAILSPHVNTIEWTESYKEASHWIEDGHCVVGREFIKSKDSKGLDFIHKVGDLTQKPYKLYSKYVKHTIELRINVYKGEIITVLEKRAKESPVAPDKFVWEYTLVRDKNKYKVKTFIKNVSKNVGLDFYGLDVLVDKKGKLHLLEVNSAPVLFGQTAISFISAIKRDLV